MRSYSIPFITCLLIAVFYTGYTRTATRYTIEQPIIRPVTNPAQPPSQPYSYSDFSLYVTVPARAIETAFNFSMPGNKAYAFKPAYIPPVFIDMVQEVTITSVFPYKNGETGMNDVTAICTFSSRGSTLSLSEVIDLINNEYYYSGDNKIDEFSRSFEIELSEPPSSAGEQQFVIELITDKNARLADTTEIFTLIP